MKGVLLVLASVGMFFALDDAAGLLKWLPSMRPSVRQTSTPSPGDSPDASAFYLLLQNDAESRGRGANPENPPASPIESDSFGDLPPAGPDAGVSQRSDARETRRAPPQARAHPGSDGLAAA